MQHFFLSYGHGDRRIADELREQLMKAFPNELLFFMSGWDILPGDQWKQRIKESLRTSTAIVLLLTPEYMKRPWAHVEWTPFWLDDRKVYVLITRGVNTADLISPMKDGQTADLFQTTDVRKLLSAIGEQLGSPAKEPDTIAEAIALRTEQLFNDIETDRTRTQVDVYKGAPELLPRDDRKKEEVFWHFLEKEPDPAMQQAVFSRIDDPAVQGNILNVLIDRGRMNEAAALVEHVANKDYLRPALRTMVTRDLLDTALFERLLTAISDSNMNVRNFSEYVSETQGADHPLLPRLVPLQRNMAELRNFGKHLITKGQDLSPLFEQVMDRVIDGNAAEARNLLKIVMDSGPLDAQRIRGYLFKLAPRSRKELRNTWLHLRMKDEALAEAIKKELNDKGFSVEGE